MTEIENQFSLTPRGLALLALMRHARDRADALGVSGLVLFEAIAMLAGREEGLRAGLSQLHRMAGLTLRNTRAALERLERAELVTVERQPPVLAIRTNLDMGARLRDAAA